MLRTSRQIRRTAALFAAIALLAAACGNGSDDSAEAGVASISDGAAVGDQQGASAQGTAEAPTNAEDAFGLYDACMKEAGIEIQEVEFDGAGGIEIEDLDGTETDPQSGGSAEDPEGASYSEADAECSKHLVNVDAGFDLTPEQEAAFRDANLKWEKCMTDQGIEITTAASGGLDVDSEQAEADPQDAEASQPDFDFEAFDAASEKCQSIFDELDSQLPDVATEEEGQ